MKTTPARAIVGQHELVQPEPHVDVLFIEQLAERLGMSVRTINRRLRAGAFPIPELPRLDHRRRWSPAVVQHWIDTAATEKKSPLRVVRSK